MLHGKTRTKKKCKDQINASQRMIEQGTKLIHIIGITDQLEGKFLKQKHKEIKNNLINI